LNLLFLTLAVVLLALTYLRWRSSRVRSQEQRTDLQVRRDQAQQYLRPENGGGAPAGVPAGLPLYSLEHKVRPTSAGLEKMADQHGVELTSIRGFPSAARTTFMRSPSSARAMRPPRW
jgi:hypothetical protein